MSFFSTALGVVNPVASFAAKHWKAALGGLAFLALGIALWTTRHTLAGARADNAKLVEQAGGLKEKLATTQNSLDIAQIYIDANNARITAAAAELERMRQKSAADDARAAERWAVTKTTIADLEADAKRKDRVPCKVSVAASKALEGL